MTWRARALCLDEDPDLFFPRGEGKAYEAQLQAARAICAPCPVISDCLEYAVSAAQSSGIWGGTAPQERTQMSLGNRHGVSASAP